MSKMERRCSTGRAQVPQRGSAGSAPAFHAAHASVASQVSRYPTQTLHTLHTTHTTHTAQTQGEDHTDADASEGDDHTESDDIILADDEDDDEVEEVGEVKPGYVRLRPSQFRNVPSTVYFDYPPELGRRADISCVEVLGARRLGYKSHWERVCIKNAHGRAGFEKSEKYWTSLW
jgi:hypothetical protein